MKCSLLRKQTLSSQISQTLISKQKTTKQINSKFSLTKPENKSGKIISLLNKAILFYEQTTEEKDYSKFLKNLNLLVVHHFLVVPIKLH